jgi:predicted nucleic acid-binding protein
MSVLVDTSVWIDHLNRGEPHLVELLNQGLAAIHPFVVGELACGNLRNRNEIMDLLCGLPTATKADDEEILQFISRQKLHGKGLGFIDVHLLAACRIDRTRLWTRDKRLLAAAASVQVSALTS